MKSKGKVFISIALIGVLVFTLIIVGVSVTGNMRNADGEISEQAAMRQLHKLLKDVNVTEVESRKAPVDYSGGALAVSLPDISQYPLTVEGVGEVTVEIFASPEKAGAGADGWLNETAQKFNSAHLLTDSGKSMAVSIRNITSGMGADYIVSGKYLPDAYAPSNTMWGAMAVSNGASLSTQHGTERLVGNVAGILLADNMVQTLTDRYGEITIKTVTQACMDGVVSLGYTYPYTSSTGLNFLISSLYSFDNDDPLSENAVASFQKFQENVPFVCYTTQQMRDAMSSGTLNACIMEYQTYQNDPSLQDTYEFYPFGVRHDNPLYEVDSIGSDKEEVLEAFADFCLESEQQDVATRYGFNQLDDYESLEPEFDAGTLLSAQQLWKREKDSGKPVVAVFAADVSGSMAGDPLARLKTSLMSASQYINDQNYIGLISYSTDVQVNLPIAQFDLDQRSLFAGAVQDLMSSGNTCTYDAVLQGLQMLKKAQETIPDAKLMLFVLSDGETNVGSKLDEIRDVVAALDIPIYTIGYNANLAELEELSSINEAAAIDANTEDVIYSLGSLFNAQM